MKRLISCTRSDFERITSVELKESIAASEGRVIMAQNLVGIQSLAIGITNTELEAAFGADIILLNTYSIDESKHQPGLLKNSMNPGEGEYRLKDLKELVGRPIGIYFECGTPGKGKERALFGPERFATKENLLKAIDEQADFVILGGNPGTGVRLEQVVEGVRNAKQVLGDRLLIMAGKWEDGSIEPVLGDPLSTRPATDIIKDLIDAGADVITLPAPGSRTGITVEMIRQCVEFTHRYKKGTLALDFLDGSVEGTDTETIREIGLMMKQTGADIHAIGDGGLSGCTLPENLYQLSITCKGRGHTFLRMAGNNR